MSETDESGLTLGTDDGPVPPGTTNEDTGYLSEDNPGTDPDDDLADHSDDVPPGDDQPPAEQPTEPPAEG